MDIYSVIPYTVKHRRVEANSDGL